MCSYHIFTFHTSFHGKTCIWYAINRERKGEKNQKKHQKSFIQRVSIIFLEEIYEEITLEELHIDEKKYHSLVPFLQTKRK